jgi:hypothetical protein
MSSNSAFSASNAQLSRTQTNNLGFVPLKTFEFTKEKDIARNRKTSDAVTF